MAEVAEAAGEAPAPQLPNDISTIYLVSKKTATGASTADFNSGKAMIGTGPYRLVEYAAGDRVALKRNDAYWGTKPAWENVRFKMIPSAPARVAALLGGVTIDYTDQVRARMK